MLSLQVLELLTEHLAQWATSISFPELSHLPCVVLRGFIKGCAVERFRRQAKQLVDALERNATYVGNARDSVSFAPQDLAAAATFLSSDKERAQVRECRCIYTLGYCCLVCTVSRCVCIFAVVVAAAAAAAVGGDFMMQAALE